MVKMICDRCSKEINGDKYYTINISSNDIYPRGSYTDKVYATAYSLNSRESILEMLNTTNIYCKKCIDNIKECIDNYNDY